MHGLFRVVAVLIMTAGALAVPPVVAHAADEDLVAAYGMEEEAGGTVRDMSGNGHDGAVEDPLRVVGKIGKALRFDNAQDLDRVLVVPDAPGLRLSSAMTLEAWVKTDDERPDCLIVAKMIDQAKFSYGITMNTSGIRIGGELHGADHGPVPAGEWWHLALVSDGNRVRMVANGELEVFSTSVTGDIDGGSGPLVIGGQGDLASCFTGIVDEVRLYARALTDEEILRDMVTAIAPDARPSAPSNLSVDAGSGTARLSWDASTDDKGVTGYEIHRDTSPDFVPSERTRVTQVTGLSYTEGCVETGPTYFYRVVAVDTLPQTGPATDVVSADIYNPDCAPTAPTVSVRPFNGWAEITLTGAGDDRGVTEVQLHRSTESDFTPSAVTLIATLGPLDRRYLDHVPGEAMYHYRTLAVDTTGHVSEPSERTSADIAAPPDLSRTLCGAYRLDEGRGTDVFDSSGGNNTGVLHDGIWVEGKHGTALQFGHDDWVSAPSCHEARAVTISAWVKRTTNYRSSSSILSHWADGSKTGLSILPARNMDGLPSAHMTHDNVNNPQGAVEIPVGVWTHLAASYDGTYYRLYINGELVASKPWEDPYHGTSKLIVGGPMDHLYEMVADEVRNYAAALTPQQVKAIMNTPIG